MTLNHKETKTLFKMFEAVFYTLLLLVGVLTIPNDNVLLMNYTLLSILMVFASGLNLFFLIKTPSSKTYFKAVLITSVAILIRPASAVLKQFSDVDISWISTINFITIWLAVWVSYIIKTMFFILPFLDKREDGIMNIKLNEDYLNQMMKDIADHVLKIKDDIRLLGVEVEEKGNLERYIRKPE